MPNAEIVQSLLKATEKASELFQVPKTFFQEPVLVVNLGKKMVIPKIDEEEDIVQQEDVEGEVVDELMIKMI